MRDFLLVTGLIVLPASISSSQEFTPRFANPNDPRLERLVQFFEKRDCPLSHHAADFLLAADENALDWRLLPSISMIESSGGKDYRNNNVFGWASGDGEFSSVGEGIHFVAAQLASSRLYRNKSVDAKLQTYNPDPDYPHRVKAVMRMLAPTEEALLVPPTLN